MVGPKFITLEVDHLAAGKGTTELWVQVRAEWLLAVTLGMAYRFTNRFVFKP